MAKKEIARHPAGQFSAKDIEAWTRDWRQWMRIGSALFHSATEISKLSNDHDRFSSTVFGKPFSRNTSKISISSQFERVSGLLFGMAVEAWLKGLCVLGKPTRSLRKIQTHKLRKLAVLAEVDKRLDDIDRDFLDLLESLVMGFGRFAGPKPDNPDYVIPWMEIEVESFGKQQFVPIASDSENWCAIQVAIFAQLEELEKLGKTE